MPITNLVNNRGRVVELPVDRAEQVLKDGVLKEAPEGAKPGEYLPEFDTLAVKVEVTVEEPAKVAPKPKKTAKKKATSTKK